MRMTETTTIRASVKITPKINDVFYSFEYAEERTVKAGADLEKERDALFDDCYNTVANQIKITQSAK